MTLYNVHIYREVHLYFRGIEASSPDEAARIAATCGTDEAERIEHSEGKNLAATVYKNSDDDCTEPFHVDLRAKPSSVSPNPANVEQLLEERRQVAVIWCVEDVQSVRPDLDDDQSWEVLRQCRKVHDCEFGFTWLLIETTAYDMYPAPDVGDDE